MHYHVPKPFCRKSRDTWYVQIDGRQVNLGRDREAAFLRYNAQENAHAGMRLSELFDRYLDWVLKHRSADTYAWYQYRLQRFADRFPDLTVGQLRPCHVQQWVESYPDHTPTTTRNYMRCIKRCLRWAKSLGYVDSNPVEHLAMPAGIPRDVYINPQQFAELVALTPDGCFIDLMTVTNETGCRPQESLRIEIRHIDLPNQRWILPRSEAKDKEAPRVVYLSDKPPHNNAMIPHAHLSADSPGVRHSVRCCVVVLLCC